MRFIGGLVVGVVASHIAIAAHHAAMHAARDARAGHEGRAGVTAPAVNTPCSATTAAAGAHGLWLGVAEASISPLVGVVHPSLRALAY